MDSIYCPSDGNARPRSPRIGPADLRNRKRPRRSKSSVFRAFSCPVTDVGAARLAWETIDRIESAGLHVLCASSLLSLADFR
jgi:hypothetical protein